MILHAALERAREHNGAQKGGGRGGKRVRWFPQASPLGWMKFLRSIVYNVGGLTYSALDVEHSILRTTRPLNDNLFLGRLLPNIRKVR